MSAESLTPSRQCQHCKAWVWLPNWWTHNRKCELANAKLTGEAGGDTK